MFTQPISSSLEATSPIIALKDRIVSKPIPLNAVFESFRDEAFLEMCSGWTSKIKVLPTFDIWNKVVKLVNVLKEEYIPKVRLVNSEVLGQGGECFAFLGEKNTVVKIYPQFPSRSSTDLCSLDAPVKSQGKISVTNEKGDRSFMFILTQELGELLTNEELEAFQTRIAAHFPLWTSFPNTMIDNVRKFSRGDESRVFFVDANEIESFVREQDKENPFYKREENSTIKYKPEDWQKYTKVKPLDTDSKLQPAS